jgi:hypothetical protein
MSDQTADMLQLAADTLPIHYTIWIEVVTGRFCAGWTGPDGNPNSIYGEGFISADIEEARCACLAHFNAPLAPTPSTGVEG